MPVNCLNPPKGPDLLATGVVLGFAASSAILCLNPPKGPDLLATWLRTELGDDFVNGCLNPPKGPDLLATGDRRLPLRLTSIAMSQSPEGS